MNHSAVRPFVLALALMSVLLPSAQPARSANPIPGEVSCDKGVEMPKVQALVKRTVAALQKNMDTVVAQINHGDPQWKDGSLYVAVFRGTTVLAHGYLPQYVGVDVGSSTYANSFTFVSSGERMALERGQGCIEYKFHNPAKGGVIEDKIGFGMKVSDSTWAISGTYLVHQ